jgi:hypothetical protein
MARTIKEMTMKLDYTIERNHSGDFLLSARLANGDMFKRRYGFHKKSEAVLAFKAEYKAENDKLPAVWHDNKES